MLPSGQTRSVLYIEPDPATRALIRHMLTDDDQLQIIPAWLGSLGLDIAAQQPTA